MADLTQMRAAEAQVLAHLPVAVAAHDLPFAGGTLHCLVAGDPALPALVLVHGRGSMAIFWHPLITRLAATRRILAIDLPGWGLSANIPFTGTSGEAAVNWWRDGVLATLDHLAIARCALMGHSLGGMVSMAVAAARPAAVSPLILEDPAGFPGKVAPWARLFFAVEPERLARLSPQPVFAWARHRLTASPPAAPALTQALATLDRLITTQRASGVAAFHRLLPLHGVGYTLAADLPKLTMPTHLLLGAHDPLVPRAVVTAGMRAIPHADLTIIPDAAHTPHLEQPDATAALVTRFIAQ
ncbi:MAG: alpha/beta fold hydrolase [Ktedonobacterales bacterium]|nr:alpha/beta fold hydrolase [Ktedonobacterales bacterium]